MTTETKLNKVKKPFYKRWWVWVLAVIIIGSALSDTEETVTPEPETKATVAEDTNASQTPVEATETVAEETEATEETTVEEEPVEEEKAEPEMTVSQGSAIQKAESYISMGGFSKSGLIEQLKFEGFSDADATFAVDNITVDWNEQAKIKAEGYMEMGGFSRQSLMEQLKFEGFTDAEATYGVDQVGL